MFEDSLQQIHERWKMAFHQYKELKTAAEAAVVRWEWTSGQRYSLLPYFFNRYPGRARALKGPPDSRGYYTHYGFDAQDRVQVERFYNYLEMGGIDDFRQLHLDQNASEKNVWNQTFYTYQDGLAESIEFSISPRTPLKIHQVYYQANRVSRYVSFELNGYTPLYGHKGKNPQALYDWLGYNGRRKTVEDYHYDGDRVSSITGYYEFPGLQPYSCEERFSYDEAGKLERIECFYDTGSKRMVYQKRKPGQTFGSIREAASQKMVAAVVELLRRANIQEKVYCVELSYQAVTEHFPPAVIPGPESYRQRLVSSGNPDDRFGIFAPVMQGEDWFLQITDPDTLAACQQLEQEIQSSQNWAQATQILREVAAALTNYDWTGILDVTPDFVVFAIDHEMEADQLQVVLKKSASKELIRAWKKKGWL